MLIECHRELFGNKATGVDRVTKEAYEKNLEENIENLVDRLKKHGYRPQPVRRTYIPKGNDKRPLGIPAYEDKIVQLGLNKILQAIYEQDFLSPTLANVYLHYALDLWFEKAVKPGCKGEAHLVRYADDVEAKLRGHYNYYGVTDNYRMIKKYHDIAIRFLFKWLNRRSQRKSVTWERFNLFLKQRPLPTPRIHVNLWARPEEICKVI